MKYIKYLLIMAVAAVSLASCDVDPEDTFSDAPTAPVMTNHSDILITEATQNEDVTFNWSKARFIGENLAYNLMAVYEGDTTFIAPCTTTYYTIKKIDLKAKLEESFPSIPDNESFQISLYVTVAGDDGITYSSDPISVNIYADGDGIMPIGKAEVTDIVITKTNAIRDTLLLSWSAAKLNLGEEVLYNLYIVKNDSDEMSLIASEMTDMNYTINLDKLNDLVIAAGYPENATSEVPFKVQAYSAENSDGLYSDPVNINITTYAIDYPEYIYLPGSYQSWTPATAPTIPLSSIQKGYYEGMIDFETVGSGDVEYKFIEQPAWPGDVNHPEYKDFTFSPIEVTEYVTGANLVTSSTLGGDNVKMPAGFYDVIVDKKNATLMMIQINTLGLIGDAVGGWGEDQAQLTYDSSTSTWTGTANFTGSGSFKIRYNEDWTYSYGSDGTSNLLMNGEDNISGPTEAGEYTITVDVSTNPYTITLVK
ncbi:MAG: SusE domain-containing protein [Bacteroidales bacterium]